MLAPKTRHNFSAAKRVALAATSCHEVYAGLAMTWRVGYSISPRYRALRFSFYTSTRCNLSGEPRNTFAVRLVKQPWIGRLRITDPSLWHRDGRWQPQSASVIVLWRTTTWFREVLIKNVLTGYDANLTATHLAARHSDFVANNNFQGNEDRTAFLGLSTAGRIWFA